MPLRPGAGAGQLVLLAPLLQVTGTRLAQLGLDGPGAPCAPVAVVVAVAAVRADLLLVEALCLAELGSAVLKPDLEIQFRIKFNRLPWLSVTVIIESNDRETLVCKYTIKFYPHCNNNSLPTLPSS